MSAASDAAAAARRAAELAAAAAKKAFTESPCSRPRWSCRTDAETLPRSAYSARRGAGPRGDGRRGSNDRCFAEVAAARRREAARRRLACATLAPHFLALLARRRKERLARAKRRVKAAFTLTRLGRGFVGQDGGARRQWEIVRRKFCRNCGRAEPNGNYCKGCGYRRPSLEGEAKPVGTGAAVPIRRPRATSARRDDRRPNRQLRSGSAGHRDPADALRAARAAALAPKSPTGARSVVRDAFQRNHPCRPLPFA